MKLNNFWKPLVMLSVAAGAPGALAADPQVDLKTNHGTIRLELYPAKAPKTVENFLQYVKDGHFNGTIFHRVIDGFMIQGGGFDKSYKQKADAPADRERGQERPEERPRHRRHGAHQRAAFGHRRSSSSTARTTTSSTAASAQDGWGYTVFGKVVSGMDVVMKISKTPTGAGRPLPHRRAARDGGHRIRHRWWPTRSDLGGACAAGAVHLRPAPRRRAPGDQRAVLPLPAGGGGARRCPVRARRPVRVLGRRRRTHGHGRRSARRGRSREALRALAGAGVKVHVMHGNRDFLFGKAFLDASGAQLLDDPSVIKIRGQTARAAARRHAVHGRPRLPGLAAHRAFRCLAARIPRQAARRAP